jgi:two-component system, chemotaxis family, protein-glutamate methylesterase/glutaminase
VIKVLVVDDSALMRKLLGQIFSREPEFVVAFAPNGVEALEKLASFEPNVITLDVHMPQMDGLACLDRIMVERPCPVVMVSSLTAADADATLEAFRLGAVDFVVKPGKVSSLYIDELGAELLSKVRAAAGAKLKSSLRLKDRIRHQVGAVPPASRTRKAQPPASVEAAVGEGLVLVGTSTGGPPALEALLASLPAGFAWPILIAQHMPASFTGPLARRLDGLSALTVMEVCEPVLLKAGCAYIARGGGDLVVGRRSAGLVASPAAARPDYLWHPSTDRLVRSALDCLPAGQLVGVLMTGMGNDGAEAMALVHQQGGRTIAEAEESAVVWGMPGELVQLGGADFIVALPGIASQLQRLIPPCR